MSTWLVGYPLLRANLRGKQTVLLSDVLLAHDRPSYTSVVRINADRTPVRDHDSTFLGVDLSGPPSRASRSLRLIRLLSDAGRDEKVLEELGERGWPVPEREWDLLREALESRRTTKQRERIERMAVSLQADGPEQAQARQRRL